MNILRIPLVIILAVLGSAFHANAQTETILYSFGSSPNDGSNTLAGLVRGSDGNFYGTTQLGGSGTNCPGGCGTVFQISPEGNYTSLYSFAGPPDGRSPFAGLVQGGDGNFYGTTGGGGASSNCDGGCGTVFRISPSGSYTNLYSFAGPPNDGMYPFAGLIQGSDANFYGTTSEGGSSTNCEYGCGTIFRISPGGSCTNLHSFGGYPNEGGTPYAALVQANDGNFYGTTYSGGASNEGTVFRIGSRSAYKTLYSFGDSPRDGANPYAGVVLGSDGNLYGTTTQNGGGYGTVFRISLSGVYKTLYYFNSVIDDGFVPYAGLILDSGGNLYGTTTGGGSQVCECGTVFLISPSGSYKVLYSFGGRFGVIGSSSPDGSTPYAGLVQGSDGNLYGTTSGGGSNNEGTVFELAIGAGENCTYSLSPTVVILPAKGTDCVWTAVSNNPFITITSGTNGTGNGKVDYTVIGNTNALSVGGSMTIAGQTVTIEQVGGGCTFKLSPKDRKFKAAGGTGTVKVTPNLNDCDWTAVSNDSFITITEGAGGMGKGTVTYTVASNTNSTPQIGSMTIGGQVFTVTVAPSP
jgi:uncharacterized repeat protein (TIGR03803 family)